MCTLTKYLVEGLLPSEFWLENLKVPGGSQQFENLYESSLAVYSSLSIWKSMLVIKTKEGRSLILKQQSATI
jgi:hypothetical protein